MQRVVTKILSFAALAAAWLLAGSQTAWSQQPTQAEPGQPAAQQGALRGGAAGGGAGGPPQRPGLDEAPWESQTEHVKARVTLVAPDLQNPWGLVFLPDGNMLVTERPGRLRIIRDGELDPRPIEGLPDIRAAVIGGLLDLALHPDFERNRLIYFSYSKPETEGSTLSATAVARARWDGGYELHDVEDVFVANQWYGTEIATRVERCCGQGPADGSFGSRILFDDDGYLYITIGDRNWGERAQDPTSHLGKVVRVHDDGSIPADNPFVDEDGFLPELYTLGHRNQTGMTIHPRTGDIWTTEFGPRGGDELNRLQAGANYGWILVTPGEHYDGTPQALGTDSVPGMEDPVLQWTPAINPGNLLFYYGDRFPEWEGNMLMATKARVLLRVEFDENGQPVHQERMFSEVGQRLRDVRLGPDGYIYLLTDEAAGAILRVER